MIKTFINKLIRTSKTTIMTEGKVKFFNQTKGFGFITIADTQEEVFVHSSNLIDQIQDADHVKFNVEKGDKGLMATKVQQA